VSTLNDDVKEEWAYKDVPNFPQSTGELLTEVMALKLQETNDMSQKAEE
jgi:hypothetical protein